MSSPKTHPPEKTVLVLTGPTGVGKTGLSLAIAKKLPVEIVSADSRQIYRYMDIGTAKPDSKVREQVPHHFIDILNPDQDYSAGAFANAARQTISEILMRGKIPLVVGGAGLYIQALLVGFFKSDVKDLALREWLYQRLEKEGIDKLYAELKKVDRESAQKTHPNNVKRVIRALEVYLASGEPLSQLQKAHQDPAPFPWVEIALFCQRQLLYRQINQRVEKMFERGLVAEVQRLLNMGYSPTLNSLNSVGYKEVIAYLQDEMDLFNCKELVKQNTRRYAKRQLTWLRGDKDVNWLELNADNKSTSQVAEQILEEFNIW
ncbi:MAG: tRNA (adenosine(37)-N6)-dimethylallyltransferase MiaA [Calditrichae bacterium]|nr:tRNA (adenosine(37)-N6)-dimethylallyltransferase MiaA [Calditrichia bacterium]